MRPVPLLVLLAALAAPPAAAAQAAPPRDTIRLDRPPAADSIRMADEEDVAALEYAEEADTVPAAPLRTGPYVRSGGAGPFTVESSGQPAPRAPRGEVVWVGGPPAPRVAARDTAATRPAPRDTAVRRPSAGGAAPAAAARTASATTSTTTGTGARPRTHTVSAGETFYGIARRYGVTPAQLRALNPDVEVDLLVVGDVLRLPAGARDGQAGAQPPQRTAAAPAARPGRTHTVQAGETLFGIARRYGVSMEAIRRANEMETDQVRTGQRLVIPPAD